MTQTEGVRARRRAQREADILRIARTHLSRDGAAALSLRAIARDMGVASSALYRYVSDRDELLTRLVVDAYTDLARHVESAVGSAGADPRARITAFGHGMRRWALEHQASWGLIYGTPVPGYTAPAAQTLEPGTRLPATLLRLTAEIPPQRQQPSSRPPSRRFQSFVEENTADLGVDASPAQAAQAVELWAHLLGAVSMEVFGHLGPGADGIGEDLIDRAVAHAFGG